MRKGLNWTGSGCNNPWGHWFSPGDQMEECTCEPEAANYNARAKKITVIMFKRLRDVLREKNAGLNF